ncbi:hypothetical protein [Pseudoxanthomonas sangjuensis]|uniref:hypothetical protein n=1 Tax=Pseudoxanthomonas sangjuensis TaxID=1503750 RepID=UPI0013919DD0|nr:hypothetical protein [Pseudoxanthomonas sangjuensis]
MVATVVLEGRNYLPPDLPQPGNQLCRFGLRCGCHFGTKGRDPVLQVDEPGFRRGCDDPREDRPHQVLVLALGGCKPRPGVVLRSCLFQCELYSLLESLECFVREQLLLDAGKQRCIRIGAREAKPV